ncbi:hypothetical protein NDU88_001099 [Pleurodeles waltl]|uniref:Uncharacterized protein n=1 Tax=Pleurodeles waltl TaxID=8319 RepID=A0AAV7LBS9_PLEWA|nr:hypothetical protein NDU88_001099 [Pleurodeles waltl]
MGGRRPCPHSGCQKGEDSNNLLSQATLLLETAVGASPGLWQPWTGPLFSLGHGSERHIRECLLVPWGSLLKAFHSAGAPLKVLLLLLPLSRAPGASRSMHLTRSDLQNARVARSGFSGHIQRFPNHEEKTKALSRRLWIIKTEDFPGAMQF